MSVWSRGSPSNEKTGFTITHPIPAVSTRTHRSALSPECLGITWGQPVLLSPESPNLRAHELPDGLRNPIGYSRSVVRPGPPRQVINNGLHSCGQTCICGVLCPDRRGCPDSAHFCSAGTPSTVREPPDTPPGAIHTHDHRLFTRGLR